MKLEQLAIILDAHARFLTGVGADGAAEPIRLLASALAPVGAMQVAAACKKLLAGVSSGLTKAQSPPGLSVRTAADQLRLLVELLEAASSKAGTELSQFLGALQPFSQAPIGVVRSILEAPMPKARAAQSKRPAADLDFAAIRQLADQLAAANGDDLRFKSVLSELKAQKLARASVFQLANRFLGVEASRTYKSAAAAFQRIEERHFQDAVSASRERAITQINH